MVGRVFQAVYKEVRGLHQAAYVLALFTFGSQILALIRDRLLAHQFGAGTELDLYYAAFRIPDLLYVLFASTLSVYVLIPFVAERLEKAGGEGSKNFLSQIFSLFVITYTVLALAIGICAPKLVPVLFPGFVEFQDQLVLLIRILLIQPFLLGISSLFGVVTQLGHRFVLYALSPLIYNAGIIFGLLVLFPHYGLSGLVWGVVLGALGHMSIQLPFVFNSGQFPCIVRKIAWQDMRSVLLVSIPRAVTLSLHQVLLLVLVGFASTMTEGSVSVFQFAFNLQSVPLAIIGASYSVAAFPLLAQLYTEQKMREFGNYIVTALKHIIFWSLPALVLIVIIRAQFVRVVLGSGAFNWDDTRLTAAVLAMFAISLVAQGAHLLLVRALYAVGNTRLPFYVTLGSSVGIFVLTILLHTLFVSSRAFSHAVETWMRVSDVPGTEVLMLPLGYTLAIILHSVVLLILARKQLAMSIRSLLPSLRRAMVAALFAGMASYATLRFVVEGIYQETLETLVDIFLQGFIAGMVGILGAFIGYRLQRSPELAEVVATYRRKIFKTDVVAPHDDEHLAV